MKKPWLELEDGTVIRNPSESEIAEALGRLDPDDNSFAILSRTDLTYLQTAPDEVGFVLEYQIESVFQHYQSVEKELTLECVVNAFVSYSQGTGAWKRGLQWERIDVP